MTDQHRFEVGQRVKCISTAGIVGLTEGKEYELTWVDVDLCQLKANDEGHAVTVYTRRFVPADPQSATAEGSWERTVAGEEFPAGTFIHDNNGVTLELLDAALCKGGYVQRVGKELRYRYEGDATVHACISTPCREVLRSQPQSSQKTEPAPVQKWDPYLGHNEALVGRLISEARFAADKSVDALVSASMLIEDAEPDLWAKSRGEDGRSSRERLVAGLAAELLRPVGPRYPAEGRSDRALPVTNGRKL
ncbi:MAG TPA: hypothetical protein VJN18_35635 [Polyangiaceae bacterium]|nr:hypothetical protein [Polyangiaceae bacterium]